MCAVNKPTIDRILEHGRFPERKHNLAVALGITLDRHNIDAARYEEKGRNGDYELTYYSEGEGSSKQKKYGYIEVVKLVLSRYAEKGKKPEESISLNFENSEIFTTYRDRDFWLEYMHTDIETLKEKFLFFKDAGGDSLKERILQELARLAESISRSASVEPVLYMTVNFELDGIEELMYQLMIGDFKKALVIPDDKKYEPAVPPVSAKPVSSTASSPQPVTAKPASSTAPSPQPAVAVKLEPEKKPQLMEGEFLQDEGAKLLIAKKYDEAMEFFKKKAKDSPKDPEGWFGLAACLFLRGDIKKCTLYYNKCLDNKPQFNILDRLIKLSSDSFENLYSLADRLLIMEVFEEARKYLEYLEQCELPPDKQEKVKSLREKFNEGTAH